MVGGTRAGSWRPRLLSALDHESAPTPAVGEGGAVGLGTAAGTLRMRSHAGYGAAHPEGAADARCRALRPIRPVPGDRGTEISQGCLIAVHPRLGADVDDRQGRCFLATEHDVDARQNVFELCFRDPARALRQESPIDGNDQRRVGHGVFRQAR